MLGWEAKVPLRDGLAQTAEWLRAQRAVDSASSGQTPTATLNAQPRV
jgi:hypothetical protein